MLPVVVVFGRVDVNRFAWPTMNGEISLTVTVEIESPEHDTSWERLFENSCRYRLAIAHYDSRKTHVHGNELCVRFHMDSPRID
jgi:hypothetical protein